MFKNYLTGPARFNRLGLLVLPVLFILGLTWKLLLSASPLVEQTDQKPVHRLRPGKEKEGNLDLPHHPIDDLIRDAEDQIRSLLSEETHDVAAAERAYLSRRGRRPPPGFDAWFDFAKQRNATIIEPFFDRIYDDLNPFWAVPPADMRSFAHNWLFRISVSGGNATIHGDGVERPWLFLWADLVSTISMYLPDLDLAINEMDESRMVVPWETIDKHVAAEKKSRRILDKSEIVVRYGTTAIAEGADSGAVDFGWSGEGPYWDQAVIGCPPTSAARDGFVPSYDFRPPPPLPVGKPKHSYQGYVQNWTLAKSPCDNPLLQSIHGSFVEPITLSNTKVLFPLFGGSKLPMNNEILIPPAMYWTSDPMFYGGKDHDIPWDSKRDQLVWRGSATGGRNKEDNWSRFHRHRFVAMMNGTSVRAAEDNKDPPPNIKLPSYISYPLRVLKSSMLGSWIDKIADAAFVHIGCFPESGPYFCSYSSPWYTVKNGLPMGKQFEYKFLPDLDGNSFSGRYRSFLSSTSLPIKATVYDEWHDSRLVPWVHFVPMDNTFVDIYGILEYFSGFENLAGHDESAEKIAMQGKEWAERVLRREDMQIYVFRLLLEYGRLCDDNREKLAWAS